MTKQQTIEILKQQLPGFYSVEQVIDLISKIEEAPSPSALTEADIKELARDIAGDITSIGVDLVQDYDLSMSYREVELDSVDLDEDRISKEAERAIRDFFEDRGERDID